MVALSIICIAVIVMWAVVARRLDDWQIAGPLLVVVAGIVVGYLTNDLTDATLNSTAAEQVAEVILAILLFVDATEVRGGFFGGEAKVALRLLLIALPLSIVAAVAVGKLLLPSASLALLVVIACVVIPTDFAPSANILRTSGVPTRIRHILNVESGYNDGIVSPVFLMAIALSGAAHASETTAEALRSAVPASLIAIGVGSGVGLAAGLAVRFGLARGLTSPQSLRLVLVALPLLTYLLAVELHGNGFVAAFVAGIAYRLARGGDAGLGHDEVTTADDTGVALAMVMWFVFGVLIQEVFDGGVDWRAVVYGLLALTLLRIVPVMLSLLGSSVDLVGSLRIGALGPRGTASIVFGLLAFNALDDQRGDLVLTVMTVVVLGSLVLHGAVIPRIDHRRAVNATSVHARS